MNKELSKESVKIKTHPVTNARIIEFEGNIQQGEADQLEDILHRLNDEKQKNIIIDMQKVSNVCSAALGLLVAYKQLINEQGGDIKMVINSPQIYELLKVTMMDKVFDTMDNLQEAINSF